MNRHETTLVRSWNHNFSIEQVEILETESIERSRRIIEAIRTKTTKGAMNKGFDLPACLWGAAETYALPLSNVSQE